MISKSTIKPPVSITKSREFDELLLASKKIQLEIIKFITEREDRLRNSFKTENHIHEK